MGWTLATNRLLPTTRTDDLLIEHVGDETVVYDLESKNVHCLGPLAAVVFSRCDGRTTPTECAAIAQEQLGRPVSENDVVEAVAQLEERGLFHAPTLTLHNGNGGMTRRSLVQKSSVAGAAAVFAAPLITSILAPTAAMAASGIASGCAGCGKNSDCISNHCCQHVPGKQCNQGCCVDHDNSCHFCNCVGSTCTCTVNASALDTGQCPCTCGTPGCVNKPCCPQGALCCTPLPAC